MPKVVKQSTAWSGVDTLVKNFLASLPLVSDLHHPSMRDRHWDALRAATGTRLASPLPRPHSLMPKNLHHPVLPPTVQTGVNNEGCSALPGVQFVIDEKFCLLDMVKLELHKFEDEVGEIVNRAQKEEKMETALKKISETWEVLQFELQQHRDTDLQLIRLVEEDNETLEDHQV